MSLLSLTGSSPVVSPNSHLFERGKAVEQITSEAEEARPSRTKSRRFRLRRYSQVVDDQVFVPMACSLIDLIGNLRHISENQASYGVLSLVSRSSSHVQRSLEASE